MQFGIDIYQGWNYPAGMRFFIIIILFVMLWLPYLIAVHVLLSYQIKKFSTRLRLKWRDEKNGFDIDAYRVSISAKKRNRPIRDYFLSLAEKISVPIEVRNPANPRPRMEIDRFLAKRELHLRGLTIVVVFSLAGLLLFCFYYVVLFLEKKTGIVIQSVSDLSSRVSPSICQQIIGDVYSPFSWMRY